MQVLHYHEAVTSLTRLWLMLNSYKDADIQGPFSQLSTRVVKDPPANTNTDTNTHRYTRKEASSRINIETHP